MAFFDKIYPSKLENIRNTVQNWCGSDTIENYRAYQANPYTEDSITYKFNEYGFRCDNFIESKHRLVFLGCSFVEGIGLPLEETFAHRTYTAIKNKLGVDFPYWNLGLGGCGLDSLVRCYHNMYDQLRPQVAIILLPAYRLEYLDNENFWRSALFTNSSGPDNIFENNLYLIENNVMVYSIEKNLAMLSLMLEKYNTMLIWDTNDIVNSAKVDYRKLNNFKNNLKLSWFNLQNKIDSNFVFARDGMHYGKYFHQEYADIIMNLYGDLICKKLSS